MNAVFLCTLSLTTSLTLVDGRGSFTFGHMTPILSLETLAPRVAGDELAIEPARERTKVTSSDLSDTSAAAEDEETLVDASPAEVAARLCAPASRRTLDLGHEIIICTGAKADVTSPGP